MPKLPTVAIIGRPNTGKSTLFNRLVGRRKAIVSDIPGTTRDQIAHRIEGNDVDYLLLDTGGMGGGTEDKDLEKDVHQQSLLALENADLILFTLDSREELTASDREIVSILRKTKKQHVPVLIVITKCDDIEGVDLLLPQYYELGLDAEIIPVSAVHKSGVDNLKEGIDKALVKLKFTKQPADTEDATPKVAIVGKPNVGKSSLVNAFMSEPQRKASPLLVSDIAGTTRDTTDTAIKYEGKEFIFMDTAGIKRRKYTEGDIEIHAYFRSVRAILMSDIVVLVLDANEPVSRQDKRIANLAVENGKGLIILLNKWDKVEKEKRKETTAAIEAALPFCRFAPILPCSAVTREGLLKIFDLIAMVHLNRNRRIATKDLRRWFQATVYGQPMQEIGKAKHITQAEEVPPTFVLFVKNPKRVQVSQLRYLDNRLRETFGFEGTPLRWITKGSTKDTD